MSDDSVRQTILGREAVHDLRNLFAIVQSPCRLLERSCDAGRRADLLRAIRDAADRGGALSRSLLQRPACRARRVDLNEHLVTIRPMLAVLAPAPSRLILDLLPAPLPVRLDPADFEAAVVELVTNSRAAHDGPGQILIRVRARNGKVWLTVADDGRGFRAGARIRGARPVGPVGLARGVGLGRVRRFASSAGGAFHLRQGRRGGTAATLILPIATAVSRDMHVTSDQPHQEEAYHAEERRTAAA